jgi:hypothetical protein
MYAQQDGQQGGPSVGPAAGGTNGANPEGEVIEGEFREA